MSVVQIVNYTLFFFFKQDLAKIQPLMGFVAFGIVYGIPTVYMDESLEQEEKDKAERNIEALFDATHFKICYIPNRVREFSSLKVGARIGNTPECIASLAGFATDKACTQNETELSKGNVYLLMANHIARMLFKQDIKSIYIFNVKNKPENREPIATLLDPSENNQFMGRFYLPWLWAGGLSRPTILGKPSAVHRCRRYR